MRPDYERDEKRAVKLQTDAEWRLIPKNPTWPAVLILTLGWALGGCAVYAFYRLADDHQIGWAWAGLIATVLMASCMLGLFFKWVEPTLDGIRLVLAMAPLPPLTSALGMGCLRGIDWRGAVLLQLAVVLPAMSILVPIGWSIFGGPLRGQLGLSDDIILAGIVGAAGALAMSLAIGLQIRPAQKRQARQAIKGSGFQPESFILSSSIRPLAIMGMMCLMIGIALGWLWFASVPVPAAETPGLEWLTVPAGPFEMGSGDGGSDEKPVHSVSVDSFEILKYEVTNAQYAAFLNAAGNQIERFTPWLTVYDAAIERRNGRWQVGAGVADLPVTAASWYGARAFCTWVGGRLPTEAEWEYAARGPDGNIYPWGNTEPTCDLAQFEGCEGRTIPVGSKPHGASWIGAEDMAGSVLEWVSDWYDEAYYSFSPAKNPIGPSSGSWKVVRGGSWYEGALRSADRGYCVPDSMYLNVGFRCVAGVSSR